MGVEVVKFINYAFKDLYMFKGDKTRNKRGYMSIPKNKN